MINIELSECLISVEKYNKYNKNDPIDPMQQEVNTLQDVIKFNNNIPEQDLNPEYLENRSFTEGNREEGSANLVIKEF